MVLKITYQTVTLGYDGFNRLNSIKDPSGTRALGYDWDDRVVHEETKYDDWDKAITLDFPYQDYPLDMDLRKELTITNNNACGSERKDFKFTYGYDTTTGQLTSLQYPFSSHKSTWEYRYDSSITSQTLGNNAYTAYQRHSVWDQLMSLSNSTNKTSGTPLSTYNTFSYDWKGRLSKMTANIPALYSSGDNIKNWQWAYDGLDRLQSESKQRGSSGTWDTNTFAFDLHGNINNFPALQPGSTVTYDHCDQSTSLTPALPTPPALDPNFNFDANGNPTTYKGVTCLYDPENRLTDYYNASVSTDPSLHAVYRSDGLLAWKDTKEHYNGSSSVRTYFIYDGEKVVAEARKVMSGVVASGDYGCGGGAPCTPCTPCTPCSSTPVTITAVNSWGANGLLARAHRTGVGTYSSIYYQFDPLGNVVQRLDESGTVKTTEQYDAWGNMTSCAGSEDNLATRMIHLDTKGSLVIILNEQPA